MKHNSEIQAVWSDGQFTVGRQTPPKSALSKLTPEFLTLIDNLASGIFLGFFACFLIYHIVAAWPRIAEALAS